MKKFVIIGLLGSAMLFNPGCTDGEIAAGAIGVAIGVGVSHGGHHDHGGYHHGRGRWNVAAPTTLAGASTVAVQSDDVADFAARYNVNTDVAQKISDAFDGVQTKGASSFQAIGLNSSDINTIVKHQLPSTSAIKNMSAKLDMSEAQSRDLLVAMTREFESQAADVHSEYWQACMAKGTWKTAENMYCSSTSWTGCSPETGASVCY